MPGWRARLGQAKAHRHLVDEGLVVRAVPRLIQLELVVQPLLLDVGQDRHPPAQQPLAVLADDGPGEMAVGVVVVVHRQGDLLEVVDALRPPGGLARRLHRREQQRDQHAAGRRRGDAGDRLARDQPEALAVGDDRQRRGEEQGLQLVRPREHGAIDVQRAARPLGLRPGGCGTWPQSMTSPALQVIIVRKTAGSIVIGQEPGRSVGDQGLESPRVRRPGAVERRGRLRVEGEVGVGPGPGHRLPGLDGQDRVRESRR